MMLMSIFTSSELIASNVSFGIDDVFTGEHGGIFTFSERSHKSVGADFSCFDNGNLSSSNLFNIFFAFDFAFVINGLTSSALPSGLVRIISKRSSSDICLIPKLLA